MKELLRELAGESRESIQKQRKNKNNTSTYLRNLSGLHEDYDKKNIYIKETRDIEKFYTALLQEFEGDTESVNMIKEVFSRTRY